MEGCTIDSKLVEASDFLAFGGKPGELGVVENVVESEQATEHQGPARQAAVADVVSADETVDGLVGDAGEQS